MCIHVPYRSDLLLDWMELTPAISQIGFWLDDLGYGRATGGVVTLGCLLLGIHYLFPTKIISRPSQVKQADHPLDRPKSLSHNEWISLGILMFPWSGGYQSQCME